MVVIMVVSNVDCPVRNYPGSLTLSGAGAGQTGAVTRSKDRRGVFDRGFIISTTGWAFTFP
ncbi:MAG: hypothetical protein NTW21_32180 [Verrucomicrobia bacterium]|nr:hypothetical protein [Verrucomicrobiota bacterium]